MRFERICDVYACIFNLVLISSLSHSLYSATVSIVLVRFSMEASCAVEVRGAQRQMCREHLVAHPTAHAHVLHCNRCSVRLEKGFVSTQIPCTEDCLRVMRRAHVSFLSSMLSPSRKFWIERSAIPVVVSGNLTKARAAIANNVGSPTNGIGLSKGWHLQHLYPYFCVFLLICGVIVVSTRQSNHPNPLGSSVDAGELGRSAPNSS